jgi:hypothetical protein
MEPPQRSKPNSAPPGRPAAGSADPVNSPSPSGTPRGTQPTIAREPIPSGRVRHDERGNAVWDWIKDTGRHALESTSRLLKKLETPQLKVEGKEDEELRIQSDRDPGGGYDPYNQSTKPRGAPPRKGR